MVLRGALVLITHTISCGSARQFKYNFYSSAYSPLSFFKINFHPLTLRHQQSSVLCCFPLITE